MIVIMLVPGLKNLDVFEVYYISLDFCDGIDTLIHFFAGR